LTSILRPMRSSSGERRSSFQVEARVAPIFSPAVDTGDDGRFTSPLSYYTAAFLRRRGIPGGTDPPPLFSYFFEGATRSWSQSNSFRRHGGPPSRALLFAFPLAFFFPPFANIVQPPRAPNPLLPFFVSSMKRSFFLSWRPMRRHFGSGRSPASSRTQLFLNSKVSRAGPFQYRASFSPVVPPPRAEVVSRARSPF